MLRLTLSEAIKTHRLQEFIAQEEVRGLMDDTPSRFTVLANAFHIAKAKYRAEFGAWIKLAFDLSGRFGLLAMSISIQRQGELDLLLRCLEDEFDAKKAAAEPERTVYDYQLMLSESWAVGCYEILRAFRQRDVDARKADVSTSGVSEMDSFKSILADFELLRMPIAKYEVAKDHKLKQPLRLLNVHWSDEADQNFYDPKEPGPIPHHANPHRAARFGRVASARPSNGARILD